MSIEDGFFSNAMQMASSFVHEVGRLIQHIAMFFHSAWGQWLAEDRNSRITIAIVIFLPFLMWIINWIRVGMLKRTIRWQQDQLEWHKSNAQTVQTRLQETRREAEAKRKSKENRPENGLPAVLGVKPSESDRSTEESQTIPPKESSNPGPEELMPANDENHETGARKDLMKDAEAGTEDKTAPDAQTGPGNDDKSGPETEQKPEPELEPELEPEPEAEAEAEAEAKPEPETVPESLPDLEPVQENTPVQEASKQDENDLDALMQLAEKVLGSDHELLAKARKRLADKMDDSA